MRELSFEVALEDSLIQALSEDNRILAFECCSSEPSSIWNNLKKKFELPDSEKRILSLQGCENSILGIAIGTAIAGLRPIVHFQTPNQFLSAYHYLASAAGILPSLSNGELDAPVVIIVPSGVGLSSSPQHDLAIDILPTLTPDTIVIAPASGYELKGILFSAIQEEHPVVIIEPPLLKDSHSVVPEEPYKLSLIESQTLNSGQDLTIIAWGQNTHRALKISEQLASEHINCDVIHIRSLAPLKLEPVLDSIRKTHRAVVLDTGTTRNGFGQSLISILQEKLFSQLSTPILRYTYSEATPRYIADLEAYDIAFIQNCITKIKEEFENI